MEWRSQTQGFIKRGLKKSCVVYIVNVHLAGIWRWATLALRRLLNFISAHVWSPVQVTGACVYHCRSKDTNWDASASAFGKLCVKVAWLVAVARPYYLSPELCQEKLGARLLPDKTLLMLLLLHQFHSLQLWHSYNYYYWSIHRYYYFREWCFYNLSLLIW